MNDSSETIKLGDTYRDRLHGTKGVATALYQYLTGCSAACLEWVDEKTGEVKDRAVDIVRLEWVSTPDVPIVSKKDLVEDPGGPQRTPAPQYGN